ncbi:MAG: hypothetical protein IKO07_08980 [Clostridia bacterium]|nr:hypothetical protein [Clostridia bacterium]
MNRLENIRRAAHMRRVCAAGGMRCPDGRRLFRLRENPLLRARGADFVETPGGFALIGAFGDDGFFSAFCAADEEAAWTLLSLIEDRLRALGAARAIGPVAPSLIDLSGGAAILQEGAAADSPFDEYLPAFAGRALERRGFRGAARSILYELDPRALDWPRYERVAAYAARRFGLRVVSARKMGERAACEAIARLSRTDAAFAHTDEETAAMLAGLGSRWSRSLTQIALLDGEPVGYLLALEDRRMGAIRAATLQARPDFRGRALPAALALPLLRAAGERRVACGVIAEDNLASRLVVERAGARPKAIFQRYVKKLTEN